MQGHTVYRQLGEERRLAKAGAHGSSMVARGTQIKRTSSMTKTMERKEKKNMILGCFNPMDKKLRCEK